MIRALIETKQALEQRQKDLYATIEPELNAINATIEPEMNAISDKLKVIEEQIAATINPIAAMNRQTLKKDTGAIDFILEGIHIRHEVPKRVKWNQPMLAGIAARIAQDGGNPAEYIRTEYKVMEKSYSAWPQFIKDVFEPARTVEHGAPTVTFEIPEPAPVAAGQGAAV